MKAKMVSFNPTLVRLRPGRCKRPGSGFRRFNPTLVRLRPLFAPHIYALCALGFQSHAGSIEALEGLVDLPKRVRGFNPTLVRLRPGFE